MARIPYVDPPAEADADPARLRELYHDIAGLRGTVLNLYRAIAHQPEALRAFMTMSRYIRDDAALSPKLRELAILSTAHAMDVPYELYHHVPAARRAGVSEVQLAAFPAWWNATDRFDEAERAVLAYAHQVARSLGADEATFEALRRHLDEAQFVDLVLTVGWYHLCAAVIGPLQIETEDAGRLA